MFSYKDVSSDVGEKSGFQKRENAISPPLKMNGCCFTVLGELKYVTVGRHLCSSLIKVLQLIVSGSSSCLTAALLFLEQPSERPPQINPPFGPAFSGFQTA